MLKRGSDERQFGVFAAGLLADRFDEEPVVKTLKDQLRFRFIPKMCLYAVDFFKDRIEFLTVLLENRMDRPVFFRLKRRDFFLAQYDQLQCDRLDPPGGFRLDFIIEQLRKFEPDDPVKDPARLLGMDEVHVQLTRVMEGIKDGVLRDFIENDTVDQAGIQAEFIRKMPGNRFPFAVGVGGEIDAVAFFRLGFERFDHVGLVFTDGVGRFEVVFHIDPQAAFSTGRKITDMSLGRDDFEVGPQVFLNRFGFGR